MTSADQKRKRSTIPKAEARRRYIEAAELVVLDQIRKDSRLLDERAIAVGPFARLDANAVAAHEGKTRGAINNLFGSQAVFQAETMALALSARDWIDQIEYPDPAGFAEADAWVDAFFVAQSARGPAAWCRAGCDLRLPLGPLAECRALWSVERGDLPVQHGRACPVADAAGAGHRAGLGPVRAARSRRDDRQ